MGKIPARARSTLYEKHRRLDKYEDEEYQTYVVESAYERRNKGGRSSAAQSATAPFIETLPDGSGRVFVRSEGTSAAGH